MSSLLKKLGTSLLVFFFCFNFVVTNLEIVRAQDTPPPTENQTNNNPQTNSTQGSSDSNSGGLWYSPSFLDFYTKASDPAGSSEIFGERYTLAQVNWIFWSIPSFLINQTLGPELGTCIYTKAPTSPGDFVIPDEIFSIVLECALPAWDRWNELFTISDAGQTSLLATIFSHKEFSAISQFSGLTHKLAGFDFIPEAKAQGFGFEALGSIRDLWKVTRDIAYSFLIVVVIIMSFMIMFRVKLNPQTVITVQSALPKIVGAIILITFSYAIAGLLIDLMYVVYGVLSLAAQPLFTNATTTDIFSLLTGNGSKLGLFGYTILSAIGLLVAGSIVAIIPIFGIIFGIIFLVMAIILIFTVIKIVWIFLKAYASVILLTVAGPFYILLGTVIPGMGIGSWIRSLASSLSVFVTTSVLLLLSNRFLGMALPDFLTPGGLHLSSSSVTWVPFIGGGGTGLAKLVMIGVAFVLLTIAPKSAQLIQSIIKGQPFNYGSAIGEAIGVGLAGPQYLAGQAWGTYSGAVQKGYMDQIVNRAQGGNFLDYGKAAWDILSGKGGSKKNIFPNRTNLGTP